MIPDYLVRLVGALLALAVVAQIALIFGRGFGCLYWGRPCSQEDFTFGAEQLGSLTATVIALLFALSGKGKS